MHQVLNILQDSLNPSLAPQALHQLQLIKTQHGFVTNLLLIADDTQYSLPIRQSSLVALKNLIYDECTQGQIMKESDITILKQNILDALIRNGNERQLTPTFRQIIHLLAEKEFPQNWPEIIPKILYNIEKGQDFGSVASSVEALKAIVSVCGKSALHEITLNNLCNKVIEPLFILTGKLFANYSPQGLSILVSIFKIFNLSLFSYLPQIIANNIHSLMVFIKKILQLQLPDLTPLKTICLKIMNRMYSRHMSSTIDYKWLSFAQKFHSTYSVSFFQTFVSLLLSPQSTVEILGLCLSCISCIKKNHEQSQQVINSYQDKLVGICLERYKLTKAIKINKIHVLKEERIHLVELVSNFLDDGEGILGFLMEQYNSGDWKKKEIILYIYGALSEKIKEIPAIHQNMREFIMTYILPNLQPSNESLIRSRGCEIVSAYSFIELPESGLQPVFQAVYTCLMDQKNIHLNIYAVSAFSQLINNYDSFLAHIIPYLADILPVYTNLLKQSNSQTGPIMGSLQILLAKIDGKDIEPFAINLIKFLMQMFYEYRKQQKTNSEQQNQEESESDLESDDEENFVNSGQGCLASVRQILSSDNLSENFYTEIENNIIFPLVLNILQEKTLLFLEEGLNILNLLFFKKKGSISSNFNNFLLMVLYCFIGIPQQLANLNISQQYKEMLTNLCVNPDEKMLENSIGLIRNYIVKLGHDLRVLKDETNRTYMEYLFNTVSYVHTSKNDNGFMFSRSDRSIILTIYITLIQHKIINGDQFSTIINNVLGWLQEDLKQQYHLFTPIYLEVLMIANYYSPETVAKAINMQFIIPIIFDHWNRFSYEYQLQRVILGFCQILQSQQLSNEVMLTDLMRRFIDLVEKIEIIRKNKEAGIVDIEEKMDAEEEAKEEEDLIADNTHLGLIPQAQNEDERYLKECEEVEWDQEYNKFYVSPFQQINEVGYLSEVLKNSQYVNLLTVQEQQQLSDLILAAANKL